MMNRINGFLVIFLLLGLSQAGAGMAAHPPKTGERRDTLIYVRTDPSGARVLLNGNELGKSNGLFPVQAGAATIIIELEGHGTVRQQVTIRANGITRIKIELKPETSPPDAKRSDAVVSLIKLASDRVEAGDYLRAHVTLNRIDELCRPSNGHFPAVRPSADEAKTLKRLTDQVAAHIDLKAVEHHEGYVLYRKSLDSQPWKELLQSLKGRRGSLVMRVFLEDPSLEEAIQLRGERGCNMFALDSMSNAAFVQIADGEPAVVSRTASGLCRFSIGTLRHASPTIEGRISAGEVTALGDIVLLRPKEETMANLKLLVVEPNQAEDLDADAQKTMQNRFLLGRITAGGKLGLPVVLSDGTSDCGGPFARGKIWVVWAANPRQRWTIDLPAGQTTLVRLNQGSSGSLAEPQVSRTPIAVQKKPASHDKERAKSLPTAP